MGSGTTAAVCKKNNRNYLGIELNPEYIEMAEKKNIKSKLSNKNYFNKNGFAKTSFN